MFQGFVPPTRNYFPMPNEWINICAEINNLAELKVIQYVLRHTWGYREYGILKMISTDEFMYGRKRHDGTRLDNGTGLSKQSVIDGIRRAVEDGFLVCETDNADKARVKKAYKLKMTGDDDSCEPDVKDLDPDVNDLDSEVDNLDPDVKNLDSQNRCQEFRQQMSTKQTADVQEVDSGCPGSRQRSEKNTIGDTNRKTPEKNNNSPRIVVPDQVLCSGALAPSYDHVWIDKSDKNEDERPSALTIHPDHKFIFLDDLIKPSFMTVRLTHEFPHRFYSELEDKRRGRIASDIMRQFEAHGLQVAISWEHETDEKTVEEAVSPPEEAPENPSPAPPPEQEPATGNTKPLNAEQIIQEWQACQEQPEPVTTTLRMHANTLATKDMVPGELARCKDWELKNNKTGWYEKNGIHLGNIVKKLDRFRAATAQLPEPDSSTESPASNPDDPYNQTTPGMTKDVCDFVASEIRKYGPYIIIGVKEDGGLFFIGIKVGKEWIAIDKYRDWCHLDQSQADRAVSYGEYIYNKKLQQQKQGEL